MESEQNSDNEEDIVLLYTDFERNLVIDQEKVGQSTYNIFS